MLELNIDTRDFARVLAPLACMGREVDNAMRAALQRTMNTVRSDVIKYATKSSFLKKNLVQQDVGKVRLVFNSGSMRGEVRVNGVPHGMDSFRLKPLRPTAKPGKRSSLWPLAGYRVGPKEPVRRLSQMGDWSPAFVLRLRNSGRLLMVRRNSKGQLRRVYGYAVPYFAAFEATQHSVEQAAREMFEKRLRHEVTYRLGKLK